MPTLFSERIMLREFRNEDFTAICAWANDEGTTRYLSTRYWIPQSEEDCANYLNEHMQNSHNAYHFVIANQADEVYMGEIDLRNVDWRLRSGVVSMLLLKRERGRGYAREALKLMEHFAFMTLGLERLEL